MKHRLPPHIAWPLFVVGLLGISITASVITVVLARSDGGAQVIDDYYRKAVNWDEAVARQAASDALGWRAEVAVPPAPARARVRPVEITIRDHAGNPVLHLDGTVRALRPHRAGAVAERPLTAVPGSPGVYREAFPIHQAGLWDFEIVATRDTARFQTVLRTEIVR